MKILFIGNPDSVHFQKWNNYFNGRHLCVRASTYWEAKKFLGMKPDIVHAHYAGRWGLYGALLNKHPFVLTLWGSDFFVNKDHWWKKHLLNYQLKKADLITTDTERIINELKSPKVHFIQHGVDSTKFKPDPNAEYHRPIIATTKRQTSDIEFLHEVSKRLPEASFRVIEGCPQADVPSYLNKAWIYVDVSTADAGLAMSIAEAMSCGKPVVIPDHCDNANWVDKDQLYIPNDIPTLVRQLRFFLRSERLRQTTGERNRHIMIAHYNYNDEMKRMEELYERLLGMEKTPPNYRSTPNTGRFSNITE